MKSINSATWISYNMLVMQNKIQKLPRKELDNWKEGHKVKIRFDMDFWCSFPQLPEPLILSRFYNEFIGLAKESQNINGELDMKQMRPKSNKQQSVCIELNRIILKIKDLLRLLPTANYNTLKFLLAHLCR